MYLTPVSQKPPIAPNDFVSEELWKQERRAVFGPSWHLVSSKSQLNKHGRFMTVDILGVPVIIRNFNGELVALRNICAHRQAILATKPSGCSPTLRCPYHGWEYGADGKTRKLPGAANFPKFDHDYYCLDKFAVEVCGDLVFVRLSAKGPTLREWIGDRFDLLARWFSTETHHLATHRRFQYPANWKIPVENSLESYHIPCVHPNTFHTDPAEPNSNHFIHDTGTSFSAVFHPPRLVDFLLDKAEIFVMKFLGHSPDGTYEHHHIFPNLLISHTDTTSFIQMVYPEGPDKSFAMLWHYGLGSAKAPLLRRMVGYGWGQFTASLTRTIVLEDTAVYHLVQKGAGAASKPGLLGRCEERLYESQKYVREKIEAWQKEPSQKASSQPGPAHSVEEFDGNELPETSSVSL